MSNFIIEYMIKLPIILLVWTTTTIGIALEIFLIMGVIAKLLGSEVSYSYFQLMNLFFVSTSFFILMYLAFWKK